MINVPDVEVDLSVTSQAASLPTELPLSVANNRLLKTMCGADRWTDQRVVVSKLNLTIQPARRT